MTNLFTNGFQHKVTVIYESRDGVYAKSERLDDDLSELLRLFDDASATIRSQIVSLLEKEQE